MINFFIYELIIFIDINLQDKIKSTIACVNAACMKIWFFIIIIIYIYIFILLKSLMLVKRQVLDFNQNNEISK